MALTACGGDGSALQTHHGPPAPASYPRAVSGVRTVKVPAPVCRNSTLGERVDYVVTDDLKVVAVGPESDSPAGLHLHDGRRMFYEGACGGVAKLGLDDPKGLVESIPATGTACAAAAHNRDWDTDFALDVRNLAGKTVCVIGEDEDDGAEEPYAVTVRIDALHTRDPRLPALELQVKVY
ncbi:hypothetical protein ACWD6P_24805 [Streptomyces sp. NPDC002446]